MLEEADRLIEDITPQEQEVLKKITSAIRSLIVEEVFPKFERVGSNNAPTLELITLRKLRDRQLIRPLEGGKFESNKHLEIKRFGRILLELRRESLLGK